MKIKSFDKTEFSYKSIKYAMKNLKCLRKNFIKYYKNIAPNDLKSFSVISDSYPAIMRKTTELLGGERSISLLFRSENSMPVFAWEIFQKSVEKKEISDEIAADAVNSLSIGKTVTNDEAAYIKWSYLYCVICKIYSSVMKKEDFSLLMKLMYESERLNTEKICSQINPIEICYSSEPSKVYSEMTEETKAVYRAKTARLARRLGLSEKDTALRIMSFSGDEHIGFELWRQYEAAFGTPSPKLYFGLNLALPALVSALAAYLIKSVLLFFILFFVLYPITSAIIKSIYSRFCESTPLPKMKIEKIPDNAKTLAVICGLAASNKDAEYYKERLESIYFSNPDKNLAFCLLADLKRAKKPVTDEDEEIILALESAVKELNKKHGKKFFVFTRKRSTVPFFDEFEGYERKRGAIDNLIDYISEDSDCFESCVCDKKFLEGLRYIVTLDSDTETSMDSILTLVSAAVHPLNIPRIENKKVKQGYGIFVPQIDVRLESVTKTFFTKVFAGTGGTEFYSSEYTEFYQRAFKSGCFGGKGLIDIQTYLEVMKGKIRDNTVLSHDSIESSFMHAGFVGNASFSEGFPKNIISFDKRKHRWLRGDIQNLPFIFSRDIDAISSFKLFDSVMNAVIPVFIMALLLAASFYPHSFLLCLIAFLSVSYSGICSLFATLKICGAVVMGRKLFSPIFTGVKQILLKIFFDILLIPQNTVISLDAVIKGVYRRFISHKKVLEWTTASDADKASGEFSVYFRHFSAAFILSAVMLFSPEPSVRFAGIITLMCLPVMLAAGKEATPAFKKIKPSHKRIIEDDVRAMLSFYEDFVTSEDNFLPPDNVQFSPVFAVAHRTSPTNIGLYMLSQLAARDFGFISSAELAARLSVTLASVKKLKKWHGNLYNWYDTITLEVLKPQYVSSVDSGNFLGCLIALKEGVTEFQGECAKIRDIAEELDAIIKATDLSVFYNNTLNLLSIGYDVPSKSLSSNHYDLLMSEARLTSYIAVATRQVPKKHWKHLSRTMSKLGGYAGPVSWTGTMFEYFMPELLLNSEVGSLSYEALEYCLYCQKARVPHGKPFGISESCFYSFDSSLIYQYKAHGVQKLGLKSGLDNEYVVSPYSSYLVLGFDTAGAIANLEKLRKKGAYGKYGFFEAVDFTDYRVGKRGFEIVKSCMAHHVGMSVVASANAVFEKIMKKRFLRNPSMRSCKELMEEKQIFSKNIYESSQVGTHTKKNFYTEEKRVFTSFTPSNPHINLLTGGGYTGIYTDSGLSAGIYGNVNTLVKTTDLIRRPQGCFFAVIDGKTELPFSFYPMLSKRKKTECEFTPSSCSYYSGSSALRIGMRVYVENDMPIEYRKFAVKNTSSEKKSLILAGYIEPCLFSEKDFNAHPAFCRLFIKEEYDSALKAFIIHKKDRHSKQSVYMGIGFAEDVDFNFSLNREGVLEFPDGVLSPFITARDNSDDLRSVPDPCVFIKLPFELNPKEQKNFTLFFCFAHSQEELLEKIRHARAVKGFVNFKNLSVKNSLKYQIAESILPQIIYSKRDSGKNTRAINQNTLPQKELWGFGLSGDIPIIIVNVLDSSDAERCREYINTHSYLLTCSIKTDLVFVYSSKAGGSSENMLRLVVDKENKGALLSAYGGIHLIDSHSADSAHLNLLYACASHIAPEGFKRIELPGEAFIPIKILKAKPVKLPQPQYQINCGGFDENSFTFTKNPPHIWSTVIANKSFGTLLSSRALGFTWAINSHENKLTPWFNDSVTDNCGEMLIAKIGEKYYDLINGSSAVFYPEKAEYHGKAGGLKYKVTVSVPEKGMIKNIGIEFENGRDAKEEAELAYYTEPVLADSRDKAKFITGEIEKDCLILHNSYNMSFSGFSAIYCSNQVTGFTMDKTDFFSGNWKKRSLVPASNPCAAVFTKISVPSRLKKEVRFSLSYGATKESAVKIHSISLPMPSALGKIKIDTPEKSLDFLCNTWLPCQIVKGRMFSRTGFYQNGGAYGFRDQLQDSLGAIYVNPDITKVQILRSCRAQFIEGDVLHWWHVTEGFSVKGVRTKCSDDYLWLVYAVCDYVEKTGDFSILETEIAYSSAPRLEEGRNEQYFEISEARQKESVYSHCLRAVEYGMKFGSHGIPLIGSGDWNDGFNNVGSEGKGESVWLGLFMLIVLEKFSETVKRNDKEKAAELIEAAEKLRESIEESCWDGEWYLRAFFDDGTPLGSHLNEECKIDLLSQAFAVLAKLKNTQRNELALNSALNILVNKEHGIIQLFTPALTDKNNDAGYITSYPEGIRENAGQYTHAAIWLAIALFEHGKSEEAYELLEFINPVKKHLSEESSLAFKNEPYYLSADVYTNPKCFGRGGWSIYTGAASWYYKAVIEELLGISIKNGNVSITPSLPESWDGCAVSLKLPWIDAEITVERGENKGMFIDGSPVYFIPSGEKNLKIKVII